ncbi:ABC transporter permease [Chitinophaga sp. GCM10012297]|uniref:ABC transporter permease n=1 Tax=Chitinophaga chungangae TaxID=2821488 RepID=A0ABS3Y8F5_9BACT|nr:FtsX-like permease family protein [Chitinophaga chungangae]MBO9150950.1 ABC transporter permease [Chitinophaga chungangae]
MRVSMFIAGRIAFNRFSSFTKFIINIALAATAFSVAIMIVATAMINGFQQVISEKIFSFWGHMHVTQYQMNLGALAEQTPFPEEPAFRKQMLALPMVTAVNEFATKSVIVKKGRETEGMIFKGVGAGTKMEFLQEGRPIRFTDSGYASEVIVSATTAALLQLKLNDAVIVYFMRGDGEAPRARKLSICGIYKTGIEEYDKTYIVGDINLIRRLNDWEPDQIGGYEVFLTDYRRIDSARSQIGELLPSELAIRSMQEVYPNIFDWLGLQNKNEIIILVIMVIVAVINMITAILILILERTNMVGILKALGMRNGAIQSIFIYQAAYITLAGIVIGNVLGIGLALLQQHTGFLKLPEESYYMSVAPIAIQWWKVALINGGTLLICVLVLIIPSLLIRRILPVKAIQFK